MRAKPIRSIGLGLVAVTVLAACGDGATDDGEADDATPIGTEATPEDASDGSATFDDAETTDAPGDDPAVDADTDTPDDEVDTETSEADTTEPPPDDGVDTEASEVDTTDDEDVADQPAEVVVAEAQIGGRELAEALDPAAAFAGNPLPDLVVDDVGRDTRVNIANLLPSDRPVLVWSWAPH